MVVESALDGEMEDHLVYAKHEPDSTRGPVQDVHRRGR